jgi:hypothetical protein
MLDGIPSPPGSLPFFGHALQLGRSAPWNQFHDWIKTHGEHPASMNFWLEFDFLCAHRTTIRRAGGVRV